MRRLATLAVVLATACSGGDPNLKVSTSDGARPPDDMAITTTGGEMMLTVRADSMRMRVSDVTRATMDSVMAKEDTGHGFSAWLKRKAMALGRKAMSIELSVPLAHVQDARVADGALVFTYKAGTPDPFHSVKANKRPLLESFKAEDAERFAAYVRGRVATGQRPTHPPPTPPAKP